MLDLDPSRAIVPPRDAATLVVVRDAPAGLEVFCVERQKVGFLGGAIVFPGGKLDAGDLDATWRERTTGLAATSAGLGGDETTQRGLAVAACREALEEAAILPLEGRALTHGDLLAWRERVARREATLLSLLAERGARLDLAALRPMARWVTPAAESRRFDTRFYLYVARQAITGAHDDVETTASFWARPDEVLRRFGAGELRLAPPTHRTLEILASSPDAATAAAWADGSCLDPVCPQLVNHRDARGETVAFVLPGDPEHDVKEVLTRGSSRYVLRGDRFVPEAAPS